MKLLLQVARALPEKVLQAKLASIADRIERLRHDIEQDRKHRILALDDYRAGIHFYFNYLVDAEESQTAFEMITEYETSNDPYIRILAGKKLGDILLRQAEPSLSSGEIGLAIVKSQAAQQKYDTSLEGMRISLAQNMPKSLASLEQAVKRNIIRNKMILGASYVHTKQFGAAAENLHKCVHYWMATEEYKPLVQCLALLSDAEAQRQDSNKLMAVYLLRQAWDRCRCDLPGEVQLNRNIAEKLCRRLLDQGLVCDAQELANNARNVCARLACNVELANHFIKNENVDALASIVERVVPDVDELSADDTLRIQLRDQTAMYHYLSDDLTDDDDLTGESASHRESARAIWLELLTLRQIKENGTEAESARTLFYLATLNYRDWQNAFVSRLQKKQAVLRNRTGNYESRRENYDTRFQSYEKRLSEYRAALEIYHSKWTQLDRSSHSERFVTLSTERETLVQEKNLLDIEKRALTDIQPTLDTEFEAAKSTAAEFTSKIQEDLLQTLDEAAEYLQKVEDALDKPEDQQNGSQVDAVSSLKQRIVELKMTIDEAKRRTRGEAQ